jgi:hypothetical protein
VSRLIARFSSSLVIDAIGLLRNRTILEERTLGGYTS